MTDTTFLKSLLILRISEQISVAASGGVQGFGAVIGFEDAAIANAMVRGNILLNPQEAIRDLLTQWTNENGSDEVAAHMLMSIMRENGYSGGADVLENELIPQPPTHPPGEKVNECLIEPPHPDDEKLLRRLKAVKDEDDDGMGDRLPNPPSDQPDCPPTAECKVEETEAVIGDSKEEPEKKTTSSKQADIQQQPYQPSDTDRIITLVTAVIVTFLGVWYIVVNG